jgi:hypothetical protein
MTVRHQLSAVGPILGIAEPVHDIVQPGLELLEQGFTRQAALVQRCPVVASELLFEHAVNPAHFLLLAELPLVVRHAAATILRFTPMFARGIAPALDWALGRKTLLTLQEELFAFPTAEFANRTGVSCHPGSLSFQ